jgi:ubiquitin-like modifier-activating enzyme ATG7
MDAPTPVDPSKSHSDTDDSSVLGLVPHCIRGSLHGFEQFLPATPLFSHCTACSSNLLSAFAKDEFGFLQRACNEPNFLSKITGLEDLMADSNFDDVIEVSDDDDELSVQ